MTRKSIVYCFPLVNGYMAACWRALSQKADVDLFVVGQKAGGGDLVAYNDRIMHGVDHYLLSEKDRENAGLVRELVLARKPDLLIISGWSERAFRPLYFEPKLKRVPKVMVVDNQFRGTFRQQAGRWAYRPLFDRVDCFWAVGERAWQLGRFFGFSEKQLRRAAIGVDTQAFREAAIGRIVREEWPKQFVFTGRYHKRKGLDVLAAAYTLYRSRHRDCWPLRTAGMGPEIKHLATVPGVSDLGFLSPEDIKSVLSEAGVFVLPSRYDAWPLALVEAASAGLPVIATEECGSAVEVVRHLYNGYLAATDDVQALANALSWMHCNHQQLPTMGKRSVELAAAYDASIWADRALEIFDAFSGTRA